MTAKISQTTATTFHMNNQYFAHLDEIEALFASWDFDGFYYSCEVGTTQYNQLVALLAPLPGTPESEIIDLVKFLTSMYIQQNVM